MGVSGAEPFGSSKSPDWCSIRIFKRDENVPPTKFTEIHAPRFFSLQKL